MFSVIVISLAIVVGGFGGTSCATGTSNAAIGKPASQSSNYFESKWLAPMGVDGDKNSNMHQRKCFHTNAEYQPWWRVDLEQEYYITNVVIYNRWDCCVYRARNIGLTIGKSLDSMNQAGYMAGGDGNFTTYTFNLDRPLIGRYVQLQQIGITENLCEVDVMAYPADVTNVAVGKSGSMCSKHRDAILFAPTAADGETGDFNMSRQSCFHMQSEYEPWWKLDLGQNHNIVSVSMYNRLDC